MATTRDVTGLETATRVIKVAQHQRQCYFFELSLSKVALKEFMDTHKPSMPTDAIYRVIVVAHSERHARALAMWGQMDNGSDTHQFWAPGGCDPFCPTVYDLVNQIKYIDCKEICKSSDNEPGVRFPLN